MHASMHYNLSVQAYGLFWYHLLIGVAQWTQLAPRCWVFILMLFCRPLLQSLIFHIQLRWPPSWALVWCTKELLSVEWLKCFFLRLVSLLFHRCSRSPEKTVSFLFYTLWSRRLQASVCWRRSQWVGACNSHTKPMSRHFNRLIYF